MALKTVSILEEPKYFSKFCVFENKAFGCKEAYGCHIGCPLWRAQQVEYLMNNKGMTLGEAHKATLRSVLAPEERREALRAMIVKDKTVNLSELLDTLVEYENKYRKESKQSL